MTKVDYIECGDCLTLMKEMGNKSVDVCLTSPPYNDKGTGNTPGDTHTKYLNPEYRKDWFEWQCEVIDEMLRISKKLVIYNVGGIKPNRENVYKLIGKYADIIHDIVIWYKPNGLITGTPHSISNTYEYVLLLKPKGVDGVKVSSRLYRNVIINNSNANNPFSDIHHAVMPQNFCAELIREFTSEGDVVLDPFSGMGTTALCSYILGRHYIGFELNETYYEKSLERLKAETSKIRLW